MAAISTVIAAASLTVGAASAVSAYEGRKDAKEAARRSADEQRKVQAEQKALNAQQAAQERRNQIREERVRRARILQSSENTGADGSSGLSGALGSMSAQLGNNLGINAGRIAAGNRISTFTQNAADFNLAAQESMNKASNADTLFNLSGSIFNAAGGINTLGNAYDNLNKPTEWVSQG